MARTLHGDAANAIYYIHNGKVKLTVLSRQGKEAVVAIWGAGDFFGEGCLAGQPLRMGTSVALSGCSITRLEKSEVIRALHEQPSELNPKLAPGACAFTECFCTSVLKPCASRCAVNAGRLPAITTRSASSVYTGST
jgi:Cyclic nucleotide-binding domain